MSTYATISDLKSYVSGNGLTLPSDPRLQEVLDRAERDVDWVAGSWPILDTTTGRKFDPTALVAFQATQLKYATCAQAEYRLLQGETFMAKSQHQIVRLADDSGVEEFRSGTLPYIGPKVIRELELGGLMRTTVVQSVAMGPRSVVNPVIGNLSDGAA